MTTSPWHQLEETLWLRQIGELGVGNYQALLLRVQQRSHAGHQGRHQGAIVGVAVGAAGQGNDQAAVHVQAGQALATQGATAQATQHLEPLGHTFGDLAIHG